MHQTTVSRTYFITNIYVQVESATKGVLQQVMSTAFGITIYRSDIQTLEGLNWLNDQVRCTEQYNIFQHTYKVH